MYRGNSSADHDGNSVGAIVWRGSFIQKEVFHRVEDSIIENTIDTINTIDNVPNSMLLIYDMI